VASVEAKLLCETLDLPPAGPAVPQNPHPPRHHFGGYPSAGGEVRVRTMVWHSRAAASPAIRGLAQENKAVLRLRDARRLQGRL